MSYKELTMDVSTIRSMKKDLMQYLSEFDDCFCRRGSRRGLRTYVSGQLSDLPRKSIEPMALDAGVAPRTLQCLITNLPWDDQRFRDKTQRIVARDHSHPQAVGTIDDTGHPKKGTHTPGVQRQWCGNTGKVDNCMVGVHLGYAVEDFQCLLDSTLFLPESWAPDLQRRHRAGIPEEVVYRTKQAIALDQVRRAIGNGIRVQAWTFDAFYGRDGEFLDGLEGLGQNYVAQVPKDFTGWMQEPEVLLSPTARERHRRGRKRHFPRLSAKASPASEVRNLLTYSRAFQDQSWVRYHIKEGEKGPLVWEVKHGVFYRKQGPDGLPGPLHELIVARNALKPNEIKYFVSNRVSGHGCVTLESQLHVAFSRFSVERCFELSKQEVGMGDCELRTWTGIHRHGYISQVSLLFCARIQRKLREKNDRRIVSDGRTDSCGGQCLCPGPIPVVTGSETVVSEDGSHHLVSSAAQPRRPHGPYENHAGYVAVSRYRSRIPAIVCAP
jgi:SRSO17 transposase